MRINHSLTKSCDTLRMETTPATRFVTRALQAVRRYNPAPDQIDHAILCAINATLCLCSGGDDRVAEGFNRDIAANGREFHPAKN
jgi:hypothetical protein